MSLIHKRLNLKAITLLTVWSSILTSNSFGAAAEVMPELVGIDTQTGPDTMVKGVPSPGYALLMAQIL